MDVRLPDGTIIKNVPDNITQAQLMARLNSAGVLQTQQVGGMEDAVQGEKEKGQGLLGNIALTGAKALVGAGAGLGELGRGVTQAALEGAERVGLPVGGLREGVANVQGQESRRLQEQFGDDLAFEAGKIGGQIAATAPFGGAVTKAVGKALPAVGRALAGRSIASGAVAGGTGGAVFGGLQPTSEFKPVDEAIEDRLKKGALGGVTGAAFGGGIMSMAKIAKPVIGAAGSAVKGADADKVFSRIIQNSQKTPEQLRQELQEGTISTIADIGGDEVRGLTRALAKLPGGKNIVSDVLEGRSEAAVSRVQNELSKRVSSVDKYFGSLDDIAKVRAESARPLYQKAAQEAPLVQSKKLDNFVASDSRLADAIKRAYIDYGIPKSRPANSFEVLDATKKVLGDDVGEALRQGRRQYASAITQLKNDLVSIIDEVAPSYKKARRIFSSFSDLENAQEIGLKFSAMTPEQLRRAVKKMGPSELDAFRIGVRENLAITVARTSDDADPARRIFGNSFKRDQLKAILGGQKQYDEFEKLMREEINAAKTKFKILGGSRSDINLAADANFIDAVAKDRGGDITILGLAKNKIVQPLTDSIRRRYTGINNENAAIVAKALVDKQAGIKALDNLIQNQKDVMQRELIKSIKKDVAPSYIGTGGKALGIMTGNEEE